MHSNQQLDAPHEHFCAKLLSDYTEFEPEICSCTTKRYFQIPRSNPPQHHGNQRQYYLVRDTAWDQPKRFSLSEIMF